ncbi:hypothetical protein LXL04_032710 [Taraxacum kok-saghyz]
MTSNGGRDEGFQVASHVKDDYIQDVNVVVGNKQSSQLYNELQVSKVDKNVNNGRDPVVVVHGNIISQPQQESLAHWERFLHVKSIKVMLVENDDSTRHIVTALLRNCNYEVIEASNGFQAWKILENLSNHIDIVLTEVVMPSFSGVGLLCKIMSHKTRKNIPVIMMSSHDSMGLVFKCLSKGAVDFLLKPIRKNELKNLWQHVWRRCHSSSGSGSESGTNGQKSVNSKRSDDIESTHDGSDDGSGTQSSWTKQAVELESPQAVSPCDSTCGLVIHSVDTRDLQGQNGHFPEGIELETGGSKDSKNLGDFEAVKDSKNILEINDSRETITELSLKKPREVNKSQNGHNALGHSELSAFTRYNTRTSKQADIPEGDVVGPPQAHHIHHHHHVHHYHKMESNQPDNDEDSGLKKLAASARSSNVLDGGGEGNIGNCSLNGSGSGSKHGSNGQNGSSTAGVNLLGKKVESGGGLAGKSGSEDRIEEDKSDEREAALVKFREKRKDRCFKKKVNFWKIKYAIVERNTSWNKLIIFQVRYENRKRGHVSKDNL